MRLRGMRFMGFRAVEDNCAAEFSLERQTGDEKHKLFARLVSIVRQ